MSSVMMNRTWLGAAGALILGGVQGNLLAQEPTKDDKKDDVVELEKYVAEDEVEDNLNMMPTEPVKSVFGFDKTILETPRSVTSISSEMLQRYDITDIDDLVALTPGSFTQSFFGVAGSLEVRGTPGETYFRGVRRIDNPGNYPTPIGATDRIDIVRGPASPIYGPSKIGGYLNFIPKSARAESGQYLEKPVGEMSFTGGQYGKRILRGEVGGPTTWVGKQVGYYLYAEIENSDSYYNNTQTDQTILQSSFNVELSDQSRIEFGGMYHEYDGNQVAGWNRVTQDLIDNGTYITGSPAGLDANGDGSIAPNEVPSTLGAFNPQTQSDIDPINALVNPGIAKLDGNNVLVAPDDTLQDDVLTLYFDYFYDLNNGAKITNKMFYESLENLNENAYGFSQFADTWAVEDQLIFAFSADHADWFHADYQLSPSIRYTSFEHGGDFFFEYFDRRDLTGPSTAIDRRLLATRSDGVFYSNHNTGSYTDYGLSLLTDMTFARKLHVLLGGRYDILDMNSHNRNDSLNNTNLKASDTVDGLSWTASLSYDLPYGLKPYVTASEQKTVIAGQGGELDPTDIRDGNAFGGSDLREVGVKGSFWDGRLYTSLAWFNQERTDRNAQNTVTNNTTESEGIEFEFRLLATDRLTFTGAYTNLEVINKTAEENGSQFSFLGVEDLPNIDPTSFFGGAVLGFVSNDNFQRAGIPENIYSLYATYDFGGPLEGFNGMLGATRVSSVYSGFSNSVKLPAYTLVNAGLGYKGKHWSASARVKNVLNEKYFRSNFPDLFGSVIVLPELPRTYEFTLAYKF